MKTILQDDGTEKKIIEYSDLNFQEDSFDELNYDDKANFLSYVGCPCLHKENKKDISELYSFFRLKLLYKQK